MADDNPTPTPIRFTRNFVAHKITWEFQTADEVDRFTQAVMALFREPGFVEWPKALYWHVDESAVGTPRYYQGLAQNQHQMDQMRQLGWRTYKPKE